MSTGAALFMATSWTFVLGLTLWSFARILRTEKRRRETPDPSDDRPAGVRVTA